MVPTVRPDYAKPNPREVLEEGWRADREVAARQRNEEYRKQQDTRRY
jgi:hypothetical protein